MRGLFVGKMYYKICFFYSLLKVIYLIFILPGIFPLQGKCKKHKMFHIKVQATEKCTNDVGRL